MYLRKVSVEYKLPELGKWVTTIDESGEHRVYRRMNIENISDEFFWQMRDADGTNSPNNNLPITHWLEDVNIPDDTIEFEIACKSLIKYLCENHHPHVSIIITPTSAELLEGLKSFATTEYLKD